MATKLTYSLQSVDLEAVDVETFIQDLCAQYQSLPQNEQASLEMIQQDVMRFGEALMTDIRQVSDKLQKPVQLVASHWKAEADLNRTLEQLHGELLTLRNEESSTKQRMRQMMSTLTGDPDAKYCRLFQDKRGGIENFARVLNRMEHQLANDSKRLLNHRRTFFINSVLLDKAVAIGQSLQGVVNENLAVNTLPLEEQEYWQAALQVPLEQRMHEIVGVWGLVKKGLESTRVLTEQNRELIDSIYKSHFFVQKGIQRIQTPIEDYLLNAGATKDKSGYLDLLELNHMMIQKTLAQILSQLVVSQELLARIGPNAEVISEQIQALHQDTHAVVEAQQSRAEAKKKAELAALQAERDVVFGELKAVS